VEKLVELRLGAETEVLGEKTCPSTTLSTTYPTLLDLGLNPGRRGGKPETNRLSYGAAIFSYFKSYTYFQTFSTGRSTSIHTSFSVNMERKILLYKKYCSLMMRHLITQNAASFLWHVVPFANPFVDMEGTQVFLRMLETIFFDAVSLLL
jgi:hypothetical protein